MKKQTPPDLSPSEKILKKLSGHFESDKKTLIDGIHSLRANNAPSVECKILGIALYKLLLDNGLNESDVINTSRLLEKVDGFLYNNQTDTALAILEVLDAIQLFKKTDEDGYRVYCFNNEIEAKIFEADGVITKTITWLPSLRPTLLAQKAKIYLENNQPRHAESTINELLEINPVSFTGHILQANLYKEKNPKKFRQLVMRAWEYAYTPDHFVQFFVNLYTFYVAKEDLVTAYAVLNAVNIYENSEELNDELAAVRQKMGRTVVTPFKVPTAEQVLMILQREGIDVQISPRNYGILIDIYQQHFSAQDDKEFMKEVATYIQGFAGQEDIIKIIQKKLKNGR